MQPANACSAWSCERAHLYVIKDHLLRVLQQRQRVEQQVDPEPETRRSEQRSAKGGKNMKQHQPQHRSLSTIASAIVR